MRGLGAFLPERLRLVDDPFGLRFAGPLHVLRSAPKSELHARSASPLWLRGYLRRFAVYMQLRTRVIDDDVDAFVRDGGRQLVLLGAGFDCRAWRLPALAGATVFEVDHPATQGKKRVVMAREPTSARVVFVPWDFEHQPLAELPARLARAGHDGRSATMTIIEGVLRYLTAQAIDSTFECVKAYSTPGSPVAITYANTSLIEGRSEGGVGRNVVVRIVGEPFRSGFDPERLAEWLGKHDFVLDRDESATQLGSRLLGPRVGRIMSRRNARSHFALVRRV